jgi:hypothetical protein
MVGVGTWLRSKMDGWVASWVVQPSADTDKVNSSRVKIDGVRTAGLLDVVYLEEPASGEGCDS